MKIVLFSLIISVLFLCSLRLEAQTSGKDSIEYNRFRKTGMIALTLIWSGITILATIILLLKNLSI